MRNSITRTFKIEMDRLSLFSPDIAIKLLGPIARPELEVRPWVKDMLIKIAHV